ncbi:MAG: hypothetical protein GC192_20160 [Bacteroidetes bacterium]|nr:hypothetical protein [Bacteroidota bacterium]
MRKEVKVHKNPSEYLEQNGRDAFFTKEQITYLKARLLNYDFQLVNEQSNRLIYNFKGGELGISALLTESGLFFQVVLRRMVFLKSE